MTKKVAVRFLMRNSFRSMDWSIVVSAGNGGPAEIGQVKSGRCLLVELETMLLSIT